jgi:homoserine O-acetyltransferase
MGIDSDTLYPTYQQRRVHDLLTAGGTPSTYVEVESPHGHDGFLIEADQVGTAIAELLATVDKSEV